MNDADLDKAWARAKELKAIPMAFWNNDQHAAMVLNDAFFQLQKIAQDLRAKVDGRNKTIVEAHDEAEADDALRDLIEIAEEAEDAIFNGRADQYHSDTLHNAVARVKAARRHP